MPSFQGLLDHPLSRMMTESFVACIDAPPVPPRTDDRARRAGARPRRRLHRRALSRQPRRARRRAAVAAPRPPEHDGARGRERRAPGARAARPRGGARRRRARGCRHRVPGTVPGAGRGFDGRHDRLECLFAGLNVARCRPRATCPREGGERGPSNHSTCDVTPSGKHLPPEPAQARTLARHTSASGILGPRFRGDDPCPTLRPDMTAPRDFLVRPDPHDPRLTEAVTGVDQTGQPIATRVTVERPLTIFLNSQEIVTAMTINDYPEYLALGDLLEALDDVTLPEAELRTSWLYALTHAINTTPSLYLEAGAIHGCVLAREDKPLVYMEDVGRHNAVDKIAGFMFKHRIPAPDKIFYTTGRLTSEMVIKTVRMGIPILVSRSGFTAWGVELARKANLTLIGRARGKRFVALSGLERIVFDADPAQAADEDGRHVRKGSHA